MRILSFDQATLNSGYSFFIDGEYAESGVIKKSKDIPIDKRIPEMGKSLCAKIKELQPDLCIIENIQNQNSTKTVIQLARLQGCLLFYCANKGIRCEILGPSEWRKALHYRQGPQVKKEELKQQSIDYVKDNLGLDVKSTDENEAICINIAAQKIYG